MTHFSLKSTAFAAVLLTSSLGMYSFAAPVETECSTDPLFAANTCDVCYTETQTPTKTSTGWTAEIATATIPWEHSGIELQEIITETDQKLPEMISSPNIKVTPSEADKIWEFHTDIVWLDYNTGATREYFIEKGDKKNLYTLKTGVKLAVSGTGSKDSILFKTPLSYEEYDKELFQSSEKKSRNICVLNNFYGSAGPVPVTPPVVTTTPPVTPPLNAAGPAQEEENQEEDAEEEVVPEITAEQTETQAGPGMWIFLLLAFIFSSTWAAWNKQKS